MNKNKMAKKYKQIFFVAISLIFAVCALLSSVACNDDKTELKNALNAENFKNYTLSTKSEYELKDSDDYTVTGILKHDLNKYAFTDFFNPNNFCYYEFSDEGEFYFYQKNNEAWEKTLVNSIDPPL